MGSAAEHVLGGGSGVILINFCRRRYTKCLDTLGVELRAIGATVMALAATVDSVLSLMSIGDDLASAAIWLPAAKPPVAAVAVAAAATMRVPP